MVFRIFSESGRTLPQGSVLGPLLGRVMYNGLLGLSVLEGAPIFGFPDGLAAVLQKCTQDT